MNHDRLDPLPPSKDRIPPRLRVLPRLGRESYATLTMGYWLCGAIMSILHRSRSDSYYGVSNATRL
jgi:hypothetical protein